MDKMSPKYKMDIISKITNKLNELYNNSDEDIIMYIKEWQEQMDGYGNSDFYIVYLGYMHEEIDIKKTLYDISDEKLLKIAIDLGIETPNYIASVPIFKYELELNYENASKIFQKAFTNVEKDPNKSILEAYTVLEHIAKEILNKLGIEGKEKYTLKRAIQQIGETFNHNNTNSGISEVASITNALRAACEAIQNLRSNKTEVHANAYIIEDPLYAYFIINSVSTIGLFLLNFYQKQCAFNANQSIK